MKQELLSRKTPLFKSNSRRKTSFVIILSDHLLRSLMVTILTCIYYLNNLGRCIAINIHKQIQYIVFYIKWAIQIIQYRNCAKMTITYFDSRNLCSFYTRILLHIFVSRFVNIWICFWNISILDSLIIIWARPTGKTTLCWV